MDLTWNTKADMNQARACMGAAISRGRIYVCGGDSGVQPGPDFEILGNPISTMEEFEPMSNQWVRKRDMPTARSGLAMTAANNDMIYAIGGYNQKLLNTVEEYDNLKDLWTSKTPMPTSRFLFGSALGARDGKIYAIGGWGSGGVLDVVECYDPLKDSWKTLKSMPTPRGELAVASASNGKIYAIGGVGKTRIPLATVEEYDPKTDTWTGKTPMPTKRLCLAATGASNKMIYAIGGLHGCIPVNIVEEYDPDKDLWIAKPPLLKPRWFLAAAASYVPHDMIYAIGGASKDQNGTNLKVLATVEEGILK